MVAGKRAGGENSGQAGETAEISARAPEIENHGGAELAQTKVKPNVLMLAIDTLRWDAIKRMPRFRAWARKRALWFRRHHGVAHCSDPNFLTILTGATPEHHGVLTQVTKDEDKTGAPWPKYPAFPSLAWKLKKAGYRTGAYTALFPRFYLFAMDEATPLGRAVRTKRGWPQVKQFMRRGAPWYFFIRTMDCHAPYTTGDYWGAVAYTDEIVVDLLKYVDKHFPNTIIVFYADHGEALGEHGMWGHWSTLYEVLTRVPLFVAFPGGPVGETDALTQHQDIAPMVASLALGIYDDGKSLLRAYTDGAPLHDALVFAGDGVFKEAYQQHRALLRWPWKYIASAHIKEGPRFELYNLREDPWETKDLAEERPDLVRAMSKELASRSRMARDFVRPDTAHLWAPPLTPEEAQKVQERLAALGYAG